MVRRSAHIFFGWSTDVGIQGTSSKKHRKTVATNLTSMRAILALCAFAAVTGLVKADDPAGSWLSYAAYKAPGSARITLINTSWTVPSDPKTSFGSNAPGWWYGVQTADGAGALIQPILAYGYQGSVFSIFNGVFDWNDGSWHTSDEVYTVQPGDKITSSVVYREKDNSYDMIIAADGKSITTNYKILPAQGDKNESVAYFVLEHQPLFCAAYPSDGVCTFENIYIEVDGKAVTPDWKAEQEDPKCDSKATIVNPETIKFTWNSKARTRNNVAIPALESMKKWGFGYKN